VKTLWGAVLGAVLVGLLVSCQPPVSPPPTQVPTSSTTTDCRGIGSTATRSVPYKQVPGVDPHLLSLDYYTPVRPAGCGPAPIVVYVHGGGFRVGDKANQITSKVNLFTGEGWVFASVNYRLSTGGVRYPTHEQDVAAALGWLKSHSAEFGGDPNRIFLVGHSSGAFIASLLSTDTSFINAAGVNTGNLRCTVSLDTEYDVSNQVVQGGSQEALYRNAFGDNPAVWAQGSPINHTSANGSRPDFLIVTQGPARRTDQARGFAAALNKGGTPATVLDASPLTHDAINTAVGAPGDPKVTPALMTFLRGCAG
jgi:arylformamidase